MRLGAQECRLRAGSISRALYGQDVIRERHRHRYEFNNHYRQKFEDLGLVIAGKSMDDFVIAASFAVCLTTDVAAALEAFRGTATMYSNLPFYRRALEGGGYGEDLASGAPTDRMLLELAGIGDEKAVQDAIRRYRAAGANLPVVGPFNAPGAAGVDATFEAAVSA